MFNVGDKVRVVRENLRNFKNGDELVVLKTDENQFMQNGGAVWVLENKGPYYANRFELVEAAIIAPLPFVVGAIVECLSDGYHHVKPGRQYPIQGVIYGALGVVSSIRVQGAVYNKLERFRVVVVPQAWDRATWKPQVGEQVYITDTDYMHNHDTMDEFVNDGQVYTIERIDEFYSASVEKIRIFVQGQMWVRKQKCFTPVNKKAIMPPRTPKPPPPPREADLRDDLRSKPCDSLCSFAFEYDNGKRYYERNGACHAHLAADDDEGMGSKVRVALAYNLPHQIKIVEENQQVGIGNVKTDVECHNQMAEYIIKRSPFRVAFITQDMEEAIAKGLFMDVEQNRNVIAAACVALRSCMEHGHRANTFCALVAEGVAEDAAFLTACSFQYVSKDKFSFYSWNGGHDILDKHRKRDEIIKFFKMGFHTKKGTEKEPFRTHHDGYVMAEACAVMDQTNSIGKWFVYNTEATVTGEGFYKERTITKQSVINVALKLQKLLKD